MVSWLAILAGPVPGARHPTGDMGTVSETAAVALTTNPFHWHGLTAALKWIHVICQCECRICARKASQLPIP
jgi:hypothetical protein